MTIQDSSPERRNLVVLAVSIIIFYLAGGEFIDQSVKLQIINVKFTNPDILRHFIWVLLLWFIFRYWITMQGSWQNTFGQEISNIILDPSDQQYIKELLKHSDSIENENFIIRYRQHQGLYFERIKGTTTSGTYGAGTKLSGLKSFIIFAKVLIWIFFTKPTLSTYVMPYFLATWAIALIVCNSFC